MLSKIVFLFLAGLFVGSSHAEVAPGLIIHKNSPTPAVTVNSGSSVISDSFQLLDSNTLKALETLLIEHEDITGESVQVTIRPTVDFDTFRPWGPLGSIDRENLRKVIVVVSKSPLKIQIFHGSGLSHNLTQDILEDLAEFSFAENIKNAVRAVETQSPDQNQSVSSPIGLSMGLTEGILELLTALESPLIENGKAEETLKNWNISNEKLSSNIERLKILSQNKEGYLSPTLIKKARRLRERIAMFFFALLLLTATFTLPILNNQELHWSIAGIDKLSPLRRLKLELRILTVSEPKADVVSGEWLKTS
jgi:hypothetical protein